MWKHTYRLLHTTTSWSKIMLDTQRIWTLLIKEGPLRYFWSIKLWGLLKFDLWGSLSLWVAPSTNLTPHYYYAMIPIFYLTSLHITHQDPWASHTWCLPSSAWIRQPLWVCHMGLFLMHWDEIRCFIQIDAADCITQGSGQVCSKSKEWWSSQWIISPLSGSPYAPSHVPAPMYAQAISIPWHRCYMFCCIKISFHPSPHAFFFNSIPPWALRSA